MNKMIQWLAAGACVFTLSSVALGQDKTTTLDPTAVVGREKTLHSKPFVLTANPVGSGSVDLEPADGVYEAGAVVTLMATPAPGFEFGGWHGDLIPPSESNPATITMTADKTVTAIFVGNGDPNIDLAKNLPITASGSAAGLPPENAVDGDAKTYWRSTALAKADPAAWLRVDLGAPQKIGRLMVKWKSRFFAKSCELQISDDDLTWTTVHSAAGNKGLQQFVFPPRMARYARLLMKKNNAGGYGILEFGLYAGPPAQNTAVTAAAPLPLKLALEQNYPNPFGSFNPTTAIAYAVPRKMRITLKVYDPTGEIVATLVNGYQKAGHHELTFNAASLPRGNYFTVLQGGGEKHIRRMLVIK